MSERNKVFLVGCDDYVGIYLNGIRMYYDEDPWVYDLLELVKDWGPFDIETADVNFDWLRSRYSLPYYLADVVLYGQKWVSPEEETAEDE